MEDLAERIGISLFVLADVEKGKLTRLLYGPRSHHLWALRKPGLPGKEQLELT